MATTRSNQTIIRNVSGGTKHFSFAGPNGATLADGEDMAINGNLWAQFINDPIQTNAIRYALENGIMEIIKTPDVFVQDTVTHSVYRLGATSGSPVVLNPDYGSYSGAASNPGNNPP